MLRSSGSNLRFSNSKPLEAPLFSNILCKVPPEVALLYNAWNKWTNNVDNQFNN